MARKKPKQAKKSIRRPRSYRGYDGESSITPKDLINFGIRVPSIQNGQISKSDFNELLINFCRYVNKGRTAEIRVVRFERLHRKSWWFAPGKRIDCVYKKSAYCGMGTIRYFMVNKGLEFRVIIDWDYKTPCCGTCRTLAKVRIME